MAEADPMDRQVEAARPVAAATAVLRPVAIRLRRPAATAHPADHRPAAMAVRPVTGRPADSHLVVMVLRVMANHNLARRLPVASRHPARAR
jgi:hypothetical protein